MVPHYPALVKNPKVKARQNFGGTPGTYAGCIFPMKPPEPEGKCLKTLSWFEEMVSTFTTMTREEAEAQREENAEDRYYSLIAELQAEEEQPQDQETSCKRAGSIMRGGGQESRCREL